MKRPSGESVIHSRSCSSASNRFNLQRAQIDLRDVHEVRLEIGVDQQRPAIRCVGDGFVTRLLAAWIELSHVAGRQIDFKHILIE